MVDDQYTDDQANYQPNGWRPNIWTNDYDPGPNWNGGTPPQITDPYQNYNGGSPVDAPLQAGHGWEWSGPQQTVWNSDSNSWDTGRWNQVAGRGLGYSAPAGPSAPPPSSGGGGGGGAVPSVRPQSSINVPPASLPGDIQGLFNQQPQQTPIQSAYQQALLKFMNQSQETPSLEDGILRPQAEVYRVQQQRNQERNRRSAVERAAATGMGASGGLDRKIERGIQDQNFNTAQYNANLVGNELNKRRESLLAALSLASATGNQEAARELQAKLAEVSAKMQQQGLNLQGQLGMGDLDLRWALGTENLNQNALRLLMGGM